MKVVIFEPDLNPLTIIDLPQSALDVGLQRQIVNVRAIEYPPLSFVADNERVLSGKFYEFALEFMPLQIVGTKGCCIVTRDKALKAWLMPPYGQARTPSEFLRNRDELARGLCSVLARGVGGH